MSTSTGANIDAGHVFRGPPSTHAAPEDATSAASRRQRSSIARRRNRTGPEPAENGSSGPIRLLSLAGQRAPYRPTSLSMTRLFALPHPSPGPRSAAAPRFSDDVVGPIEVEHDGSTVSKTQN